MIRKLDIAFKGDRSYLHGSDFFNALSQCTADVLDGQSGFVEKLAFRRFARNVCGLTAIEPADSNSIIGQVGFRSDDGEIRLNAWVVEMDQPVTGRYQFDEDAVISKVFFDEVNRTVTLSMPSVFTPIEDVIALTKHLNYAISPDVQGKWAFGQLDLTAPLVSDYQSLQIRMKNLIAGRFSVNEITLDGIMVGTIKFIAGKS